MIFRWSLVILSKCVVSNFGHHFSSVWFFVNRKRYDLIPISLHLVFLSILMFFKISKFHCFSLFVESEMRVFYDIHCKFSFLIFEHFFSITSFFRNQKTILFDIDKLTFICSIDFVNFEHFHFLSFLSFLGSELRAFWIFVSSRALLV